MIFVLIKGDGYTITLCPTINVIKYVLEVGQYIKKSSNFKMENIGKHRGQDKDSV